MIKGACNCEAVTFEVIGDVSQIIVCHCSICRKSTGSNGIPVVIFAKKDFRWTRGEDQISLWQKPGADWKKWFCKVCGSPLPGENDEARMFAPAGIILKDSEPRSVTHHIWVNSKPEWDEIAGTAMLHPEAFGSADNYQQEEG